MRGQKGMNGQLMLLVWLCKLINGTGVKAPYQYVCAAKIYCIQGKLKLKAHQIKAK